MNALIQASFGRTRTVLLALVLILISGAVVYYEIPKESEPDVQVPIVYVSMSHDGISPEDAERLLVRPMESELRGLEGVREMSSLAGEGHAAVTLEFETAISIDQALADVRDRVDRAKAELPDDTDEPVVNEINLALFPVLVVMLSGEVPERTLLALARDLRDRIESLSNVLEVDIVGDRDEQLEVVIDPMLVESYGLRYEELLQTVQRNNRLIAAGALDTGQGRFPVKVPGVFKTSEDVTSLPLKTVGDRVVTLGDVAELRRTFKDPEGFARMNGQPALALEVKKRIGTNIIDTVREVRALVEAERAAWPETVQVGYTQDRSDDIELMLADLQNNVLTAIALVLIVIVAALGLRSAGLVGVAVPGSFLAAILLLGVMGLTVNMIVLFSLILAVGMLVDGAIVVTELADRKMAEGLDRREAYLLAAQRMAWPITAATATTLAAFLPLLFWPGVVGDFMKFLPITLLATLTASLAMALVFVPNLGALIGKAEVSDPVRMKALSAAEGGDLSNLTGFTGLYVRWLRFFLRHPGKVALAGVLVAITAYGSYAAFGRGIEFFPEVEPEQAQIQVRARGDMSAFERDRLVREVESRVLEVRGVETVYARSGVALRDDGIEEDAIGVIMLELEDWRLRRPAREIFAEIRERTDGLAGVLITVREPEAGPPVGKPVQVQVSARDPERIEPEIERIRAHMDGMDGLVDVTDTRPIPGIEWRIDVDREHAGRFGADISYVGSAVQLVTSGLRFGSYRPDDTDDEVDILARFPPEYRGLDQLDALHVTTDRGVVPLSSFVERTAAPKTGDIQRFDGRRTLKVTADVADGVLVDDKVREIRAWLETQDIDPAVEISFRGQDEEQREAQEFLSRAFAVALFLIAMILVTQFNSFYQAGLILSAVVFSTVGVLLGLLATGQPFGIIMSGVGVIALAGIVVNNNIVLIDTYNELRRRGHAAFDAVLRTGAQRLRPVLLTTTTTILGLMPMVLKVNVDLLSRQITVGGPATDWWAQLATAVAGGLAFATLLTLVLTPCLLMLGHNCGEAVHALRERLRRRRSEEEQPDDQAEDEPARLPQAAE